MLIGFSHVALQGGMLKAQRSTVVVVADTVAAASGIAMETIARDCCFRFDCC